MKIFLLANCSKTISNEFDFIEFTTHHETHYELQLVKIYSQLKDDLRIFAMGTATSAQKCERTALFLNSTNHKT